MKKTYIPKKKKYQYPKEVKEYLTVREIQAVYELVLDPLVG